MFAGKKSVQIREILISESAWEEMTCLFAPSLNVEELSRLLKNVALSVINLFILDDVSEKMEYIPDWVVVTRLNIWWR
nr:hypothetical protein [Escherichia coli]